MLLLHLNECVNKDCDNHVIVSLVYFFLFLICANRVHSCSANGNPLTLFTPRCPQISHYNIDDRSTAITGRCQISMFVTIAGHPTVVWFTRLRCQSEICGLFPGCGKPLCKSLIGTLRGQHDSARVIDESQSQLIFPVAAPSALIDFRSAENARHHCVAL